MISKKILFSIGFWGILFILGFGIPIEDAYAQRGIVPKSTMVLKSHTGTGSWTDINVSADVATGASGVELFVVATDTSNPTVGVRQNGSTQALTFVMGVGTTNNGGDYMVVWVGVDEANCVADSGCIFEVIADANSTLELYIVAETDSDVTMNATWASQTITTGSWQSVNSADVPDTAKAVMMFYKSATADATAADRHGNSTDDRTVDNFFVDEGFNKPGARGSIVGQHTDGTIDVYITTGVTPYVAGYMESGATAHTEKITAVDVTPGTITTGAFTDLDLTSNTAADADYVVLEVYHTGNDVFAELFRRNGDTTNFSANGNIGDDAAYVILVGVDADEIVEYYTSTTLAKFFLRAYGAPESSYQPRPAAINSSNNSYLGF